MAFARKEGLGDVEIRRQAERFTDYWVAQPGQKGIKVDWSATFRNWIRRDVDQRSVGKPEAEKTNLERGYNARLQKLEAGQR